MSHGIQLVSSEMKFTNERELHKYMEDEGLLKTSNKYHTVSIIGGQSSGKSTLLNAMFGTKFDMMDASRGRQQTTKGIWCCKAAGKNILVLDVEGTDGREKEDQKAFEGKSALFSLALTDIMMVNMWMHEVGRFNAANLPLLRTVFEVHLKLVHVNGKEFLHSKPLLLFILRDCDGSTSVDHLQETIVLDLNKIWDSMNKPDEFASSLLQDFFEVQCMDLPHYKFQSEAWNARAREISQLFSEGAIFNNRSSKDVPAEAFPEVNRDQVQVKTPTDTLEQYAAQLWKTIESDGDLDLPTQRRMLSMVRCDTKRKALANAVIEEKHKEWVTDPKSFRQQVETGIQNVLLEFKESTSGYDEDVKNEAKDKLEQDIWPVLQNPFDEFANVIRDRLEKSFVLSLTELMPIEGQLPDSGFSSKLKKLSESLVAQIGKELSALMPARAPWGVRLHEIKGALEHNLRREEESAKKQVAQHVKGVCQNDLKVRLSRMLVPLLDEAPQDMWDSVRKVFEQALREVVAKIQPILMDIGCWSELEEVNVNKSMRAFAEGLVNDRFADKAQEFSLSKKIFEKFDLAFNRGRGRVWRLWDNPDQEYEKARNLGFHVIQMFKSSQLYEQDKWPAGCAKVNYMDPEKQERLEMVFDATTRQELVWAQMTRANSSTHTSAIFAALVLVLGWNEIYWLLTNPFYLVLLIIVAGGGGVYYFLKRVGDWQQLVAMLLRLLAGVDPTGGTGKPPAPAHLDHAKHLDGPPGRHKRPGTAPATVKSMS